MGDDPSGALLSNPYALARAKTTLGPHQTALGFVLSGLKTLQPLSILPVLPVWCHLQTFLQLLQGTYSSLSLPLLALPLSTSPQHSSWTGASAHRC